MAKLPSVGGENISAGNQMLSQGGGDLGFDIETLACVTHHWINEDQGGAKACVGSRCTDRINGFGRRFDLIAMGEIAGQDQIKGGKVALGLDTLQHPLEQVRADRAAARCTKARMATKQDRGGQNSVNAQDRKGEGLGPAADAAGGNEARHQKGARHEASMPLIARP